MAAQDDATYKCTRHNPIDKWYHNTTKVEEKEMYMINWNLPDEYNHERVVLSKGGPDSRRNHGLVQDELYRRVTRAPTDGQIKHHDCPQLTCMKPLFQSSNRLLKHGCSPSPTQWRLSCKTINFK